MMGFWDAMASAGPCASNLHLAPDTTLTPHHSIFTGQMLFLTPNQQCQSIKGKANTLCTVAHLDFRECTHTHTPV